jgi:predicted RNase H-like nuclease (RuvC/YqgF family)
MANTHLDRMKSDFDRYEMDIERLNKELERVQDKRDREMRLYENDITTLSGRIKNADAMRRKLHEDIRREEEKERLARSREAANTNSAPTQTKKSGGFW